MNVLNFILRMQDSYSRVIRIGDNYVREIVPTKETLKEFPDYESLFIEAKTHNFIQNEGSILSIGAGKGEFPKTYLQQAHAQIAINELQPYLDAYLTTFSGSEEIISKFKDNIFINIFNSNKRDLCVLYRDLYQLIYQQAHRNFLVKELGQINVLAKVFDHQTVGIFIKYLTEAQKYAKKETSLGVLLLSKDIVFPEYRKTFFPLAKAGF